MTKEKIIEMIEAHIIDAIEHCADVEYYDTVKDLDVGHFLTIHEIFEVAQYAAINMDDELIKHEQDTLKEFVEWLKDQNAAYDEKLGLNMVCMDTLQLDDMLKYFIKEQKNETNNHH